MVLSIPITTYLFAYITINIKEKEKNNINKLIDKYIK